MAKVEQQHREVALVSWSRSNDPAGSDFGPELIARALADAEERGRQSAQVEWIPFNSEAVKSLMQGDVAWIVWRGTLERAPYVWNASTGHWEQDDVFVSNAEVSHFMPTKWPEPPKVSE